MNKRLETNELSTKTQDIDAKAINEDKYRIIYLFQGIRVNKTGGVASGAVVVRYNFIMLLFTYYGLFHLPCLFFLNNA